jgi:hypothetical protein
LENIEVDNREEPGREIVRRFNSGEFMTAAIGRAAREAVRQHKLAGNPIATWQDGRVVIVQPEDIVVPDETV